MAGNCFFACCAPSAVRFYVDKFCVSVACPGITVKLYDSTRTTLIATGTTDADGWVDFGTFSTAAGTGYQFMIIAPYSGRYLPWTAAYSVATTTTKANSPAFHLTPDYSRYVCDPAGLCQDPISKTLQVTWTGNVFIPFYATPGVPYSFTYAYSSGPVSDIWFDSHGTDLYYTGNSAGTPWVIADQAVGAAQTCGYFGLRLYSGSGGYGGTTIATVTE